MKDHMLEMIDIRSAGMYNFKTTLYGKQPGREIA